MVHGAESCRKNEGGVEKRKKANKANVLLLHKKQINTIGQIYRFGTICRENIFVRLLNYLQIAKYFFSILSSVAAPPTFSKSPSKLHWPLPPPSPFFHNVSLLYLNEMITKAEVEHSVDETGAALKFI